VEKKSRKGIGGRPSKYKPEYAEQVYKLCLLGATDRELADFFGVSEQTLNTWKSQYPEFLESIKRGKLVADTEVAASLYKRAKGYQYEEITVEPGKDGKEAVTKRVVKEVAPDTGAAMAWLKNRRPQYWRDKQEIEHSGSMTHEVRHDLRKLDAAELAQLETLLRKSAEDAAENARD